MNIVSLLNLKLALSEESHIAIIYIYMYFSKVGSTHNGVMNGTRYFHCPRGHGALVPYTDVRRVNPPETRPPVSGNFMFDSYQEVVKQRALRRQKMVE